MTLSFLIEKDIWEDDEANILDTLSRKFVPFIVHDFLDFDPAIIKRIKTPHAFCYGSLQWVDQIQKHGDDRLKTICTLPNFDCRTYYPHFGPFLFNAGNFITLRNFIDNFYSIVPSENDSIFMRPSTGFKNGPISGGIFDYRSFKEYISFFEEALQDDDYVLVDKVKHINYEWRTIISNKKCIAGCQYKSYDIESGFLGFDPSPYCPDRVIRKAEEIANAVKWSPDPMYVMDIVENDGELFVMELNALSTSGWYDCDVGTIIDEIIKRIEELS